MALVAFWGNSEKETGQTMSSIAIATSMAIDHNYKILAITTGFKDTTIEESFFDNSKNSLQKRLGLMQATNNVEAGVEGLSRIVVSGRGRSGIVPNYVKVVFKDRLDVLQAPRTKDYKTYLDMAGTYSKITTLAKSDYNLVFIDVNKRLPVDVQREILAQADVIVISTLQGLTSVERIEELEKNPMFQKGNTMILLGKYDRYSKYNLKNLARYFRNHSVIAIPYNTLFFEATTEGKVADYFLRYRSTIDKTDRNHVFIEETKKACDGILSKIDEVQKNR